MAAPLRSRAGRARARCVSLSKSYTSDRWGCTTGRFHNDTRSRTSHTCDHTHRHTHIHTHTHTYIYLYRFSWNIPERPNKRTPSGRVSRKKTSDTTELDSSVRTPRCFPQRLHRSWPGGAPACHSDFHREPVAVRCAHRHKCGRFPPLITTSSVMDLSSVMVTTGGSALFFRLVNAGVSQLPMPESASRNAWKWRNISSSAVHSFITAIWAVLW